MILTRSLHDQRELAAGPSLTLGRHWRTLAASLRVTLQLDRRSEDTPLRQSTLKIGSPAGMIARRNSLSGI
jgi:hypothetical protein